MSTHLFNDVREGIDMTSFEFAIQTQLQFSDTPKEYGSTCIADAITDTITDTITDARSDSRPR